MSEGDKRPLRVGIISANWGAKAHLPAWRLLDGVEVTAICTSRQETAEAAAKEYGVARPFWDFEAMCADPDIDIIDAGTSPVLREKMVTAALEAGKHAMNEMPFAPSLAAARGLADLQRSQGVVGATAASVVGLPHLAFIKEMVEAGDLGDIFQVHCTWQMSFFLKVYPGFSYTWFGKAGHGVSVTRNQGSHMLHALRQVFGPIESVVGRMETQLKTWDLPDGETLSVETDDTVHAMLRFASGAMGTLATSWTAADAPGFAIDVFGSKGRLRLEALGYPSVGTSRLYFAKAQIGHGPAGEEIQVPARFFAVPGRAQPVAPADRAEGQRINFARLFGAMVEKIRGAAAEPPTSFSRALEIQTIVEALYESDARRAWVDVATVGQGPS